MSGVRDPSNNTSMLNVDASGNLRVTGGGPGAAATTVTGGASGASATSNSSTTAYATNKVIKAAAGNLRRITGYNSLASAQFIQLHDSAALPADASVPVAIFSVPASANFTIDYGLEGRTFAAGIVVCNSTTGPTKTIGAANCWFDAQYT